MRKKGCLSDAAFIDELVALIKELEEDIAGLRSRLRLDDKASLPLDDEYRLLLTHSQNLEWKLDVLERSIEELIASECRATCIDCHGDCEDCPLGRRYKAIKLKIEKERGE